MSSNPNQNFDERRWVIHIRRTLEEELELSDIEAPVCIFNVPKTLMSSDPESYTPQEVAIGPFHYWRPELYEMERYKLAAAKRIQRHLHGDIKFQHVVDQLTKLEPRIRACYHKFLNLSSETLAWMMAIDASFLVEFLQIYGIKAGETSRSVSSRSMSHLVDYAGTKAARNAILRDMVKLENQIPLFVLRKLLEVQLSSLEAADEILQAMLMRLRKELSPFQTMKDLPEILVSESAHLLDYLYDTIVPKVEQQSQVNETVQDQSGAMQMKENFSGDSSYVQKFLIEIWKLLSMVNKGLLRLIKKVILSKPIKLFLQLPWKLLSKLPRISLLAQPVQVLISQGSEENDLENETDANKPPLVEET